MSISNYTLNSFFFLQGTVCYDDACHLKKFASNPARSSLTTVASQLASVDYAVDRMHFKGHIDPWCREHCDPHKLQTLQKVHIYTYIYTYYLN